MAEVKYLDLTGLQRYDQKIKEVVNTGLDTKIGKDDVMLGSEDLLSSWEGNDVPETPYMTNNWSAYVESRAFGGGYTSTTIYNENNEVIFELPSSEELDVANFPVLGYTYTHNNGNLSILVELMDAPENYTANIQINPTSAYKLVFGEDVYHVRLTGDIYTEFPTNTKKSFEKLNKSIVRFDSKIRELEENKVDQTSFGQHVQEFDELKDDVRDIESSLALKADKTEVDSSLALKADKSDVDSLDFGVKSLKVGATTLKDNVELAYDRVYDPYLQSGLDDGDVYFKIVTRMVDGGASNESSYVVAGKVVGFDNKANTVDIPTEVSQLTNDAGYAVAGDLKISEVTEDLGENVAKAYKFEGGAESAVIEIPKDQTLKSVELGKIVDEAFVVDPTGEILRFTYIIADGSESVVDVNISNLITEAELDPVYAAIDEKVAAADIVKVTNEEIDAMFA